MMSSAWFTSEASGFGYKYFNGGRMTQSQIAAIFSSLGSAVTADAANTHDVPIVTPGGGLSPSSWPDNLTRDLKLLINKGRNSLGPTAMGSILTNLATSLLFPPVSTAAPVASATSLSVAAAGVASVTNGTWTNAPTSYQYQWYRGGSAIGGANTNSHTLIAADVGFNLTCWVTATNADGNGTATSNSIGPVTA